MENDQSTNEVQSQPRDEAAPLRAKLAELEAREKARDQASREAEEAVARQKGEFSKIEERYQRSQKELSSELEQLRQWKTNRESEDRRARFADRLASHVGLESGPMIRGLLREAEAQGRVSSDIEDPSESDLKFAEKHLRALAPQLFEKPAEARALPRSPVALVESPERDRVLRIAQSYSISDLPKHLQRQK